MKEKKKGKGRIANNPKSSETQHNDKQKSSFSFAKYLLPLILAGAYVAGTSFYQGLLSSQGFSSDHFPIAIDERYLMAYYALVLYLFSTVEPLSGFWTSVLSLEWASILTLLSIAVLVHLFFKFLIHEKSLKRKIRKLIAVRNPPRWLSIAKGIAAEPLITFGIMYGLLMVTFFVVFIVLYLLAVISLPESVGAKHGAELTNRFVEQGCSFSEPKKWNECVEIRGRDKKLIYRGKLVARSQNTVGIIEEKTNRAVIYQLTQEDTIIKLFGNQVQ